MAIKKRRNRKAYDFLTAVIAYECGDLDDEQVFELFQYLVDTGKAWTLQGHYGRTAMCYLENELIHPPKKNGPAKDQCLYFMKKEGIKI